MKENKEIKSIADTLEQVSGDEKLRRIAELKEKAILDEKAALDYATEKGRAEGLAEGMAQFNALILNMFKNGAALEQLEKFTGFNKARLNEILNSCK